MEESKRIRVVFKDDDDILTDTQKSEGFNRSWLLLKPHQQLITIDDVASHILHSFKLQQSCPQGLLLSKSGFVLPPFESTSILKDDDVIRVRKRRSVLSLEGSNAGHELEKLESVKRKPVNNGVLLLANEEFENEKGGYESDDTEDEDDEDTLLDMEDPSGANVDSKKRKRKAAEKLHGSKKKKQRYDVAVDVHTGKIESSSQGGVRSKKKTSSQKEKESDSSSEDNVDNNKEGAEMSDSDVSGVKGNAEIQENNSKEPENAKNAAVETKKGPSRSARRKYAKRKWLREMSKIQKLNATCESEGLKNWKEDHAKSEKNKYDKLKGPQKWKKQRAVTERMEENDEPKGLLHWKESHQNTMPVKGRKRQRENHHVATFHELSNEQGDVAQTLSSTETISKEAETIVKEAIQEQMDRFLHQEKPNQNGDSLEESNQDGGVHEQANKRNGDLTEKPNQQNCDAQQQSNENNDASEQSNQEDDGEKEIVPVVVRPGHIRFEPLEKDQAVQQNHVPLDTFQWNGVTSKKKGQKWGTEKYSFSPRNDYKNSNKDYSGPSVHKKVEQPIREIDFENLPPLPCAPKVGDLVAYRLLELSSCWTPELSEFRVGKVTWYNAKSTKTVLAPLPEYPIVSKTDTDEDVVSDNSLYKEDGSLELFTAPKISYLGKNMVLVQSFEEPKYNIDFSALIGVRIIKDGNTEPRNTISTQVNEDPSENENAPKPVSPSSNPEQKLEPSAVVKTGESNQGKATPSPAAGNGGVDPWDEISLALNAKMDELTKECSWGKPTTPLVLRDTNFGKNQQSPSNSWGKNSKNGQQSPANRWGKKVESGQPVKENSWGKQSLGSKSWSYKALRGSALGPTMAMLRSKNDA